MGQLERASRLWTHFPRFSWDAPPLLEQQCTERKRMVRDTAARPESEDLNTYEGACHVHALILGRAITGHPSIFLRPS